MGLREDILTESISQLPLRPVITVEPEIPVREAVRLMNDNGVGCVFIVDEEGKPQSKFTERHLIKLLAGGEPFLDRPVGDFMGQFWSCIRESEPIAMLIHKLQNYSLRHVCVVDDEGMPVALAGQRSVMDYIAEHFPRQVKAQLMEAKLFMEQREGA